VEALVTANSLKNPNLLTIGTELLIPTRTTTVYVVARGDTLYDIALKYNTDVDTLAKLNGVSNPRLLRVGTQLLIPAVDGDDEPEVVVAQFTSPPAAEPPPPERRTHTVAKGDTLWGISQRYGTTPQAIATASGILVTSVLHIGQELVIPAEGEVFRGAQAIPWSEVHRIFKLGTVARVTDVKTGIQFNIVRRGGTNHADCEPRTAADSAAMNRIWGGWSWDRRAIVVEFDGYRIAASMHAMPHGGQGITNNNFPGHFCVHFLNSMTHGSSYTTTGIPTKDPEHQAKVREATGK
jgi:LysM repeat protein